MFCLEDLRTWASLAPFFVYVTDQKLEFDAVVNALVKANQGCSTPGQITTWMGD